ncbi:MAG TPA: alanine--tRNA ligase-related protein, partial [Acidisoma sp.]|uniref:alanine--tRNA ligase-related protein n=1 Tax=Acidisoma sp. TaxID=1872115 RepID=UPI002CF5E4CC
LREKGRAVDVAGFEEAMTEQRSRARAAWAGSGDAATDRVWFDLKEKVGATEFLGYATESAEGEILAVVADGATVASAMPGTEVAVVLNQTPFYAESGGQVGDQGQILGADGLVITVTDTQKKLGDLFVHYGRVESGLARPGFAVQAKVDHTRRSAIRAHHSATHLLHEALRRALGTHVAQKGSLNAPERLRFDISHPKPVTPAELAAVEAEVNARIRENSAVTTRLMTPDAAVAEGAMALFGEKYGEEVRVVSMGDGDEGRGAYSIELCGGTHVGRTGDIGLLRIVGESGVSAGVRRIEAVAGESAFLSLRETERLLDEAAGTLKVPPAELPTRIAALVEDRKRLERQLSEAQKKLATGGTAEIEEAGGVKLAARNLGEVSPRELKGLAEAIGKQIESGVVALASTAEGKLSIVVGVSSDLTARISAVDLVRAAAEAAGGKGGGGRPDLAQAGGPDGAQAEAALDAVRAKLAG